MIVFTFNKENKHQEVSEKMHISGETEWHQVSPLLSLGHGGSVSPFCGSLGQIDWIISRDLLNSYPLGNHEPL